MKVLLLGEFSSLHRYLKEGLLRLGHDVVLVSSGDGYKNIGGADILLNKRNGMLKYYDIYIYPLILAKSLKGFDVVQYIYPSLFSPVIDKIIFKILRRQNKCISLVSAGSDYALIKAYKKGLFDYYMCDYDKSMIERYEGYKGKLLANICDYVEESVDVIIPSLYEYSLEHIGRFISPVLPFPINTDEIEYNENIVNEKIVFFHGLNREKAKGTPFIVEALRKLQNKYPDEVEVIIDGHMSFDKYIKVIRRANVIVDQCCSYGYGINACISMAQGKVVLSGNRNETNVAFGISSSPIIHIEPNADYIFNKLLWVLKNKENITTMGKLSRLYVESLHNYSDVAKRYTEIWNSVKGIN